MRCPSELQIFRKFGSKFSWSPLDVVTVVDFSYIDFCGIRRNVDPSSYRAKPHQWACQGGVSSCIARVSFRLKAVLHTPSENVHTAAESYSSTAGPNAARDVDTGNFPHQPVLLREILSAFADSPVANFLDGTLGAGGHSSAILSAHPEMRNLVALDVDPTAHLLAAPRLQAAAATLAPLCRVHQVEANFETLEAVLGREEEELPQALDGILLDLGVSSMQLDQGWRGFSFMRDGPLDMRMDLKSPLTAEQIVNSWEEAEVGRILRDYGEERRWRQIAQRIVAARMQEPITTTYQLLPVIGGGTSYAARRAKKGVHPATRTFQALRIAVNDELGALERGLAAAMAHLAPGGRLAVISFHSLEDRIVKRAFLSAANPSGEEEEVAAAPQYVHIPGQTRHSKYRKKKGLEGDRGVEEGAAPSGYVVLTKRPIVAEEEEIKSNPRSRSAKLRILQRI